MNREELPPQEFLDRYDDGDDLLPEGIEVGTAEIAFGLLAVCLIVGTIGFGIYQRLQEAGAVQ